MDLIKVISDSHKHKLQIYAILIVLSSSLAKPLLKAHVIQEFILYMYDDHYYYSETHKNESNMP